MLDRLILALGETFTIIALGYVLRISNTLTGEHAAGIGRLVGRIALPALLFLAMATIDFGNVQWLFLLALALGKELVYWVVLGISVLTASGNKTYLAEGSLRGA